MYYSSGNYEAFAHPKKPEGVDHKSAYIVGAGLASLTAACYLVRDGQMKGEHIHIFEKDPVSGGASGDVFSAICIMQIPRCTASKPSKFAFASDEKSIRLPTTSFVWCYLRSVDSENLTTSNKSQAG